MAGHSTALSEVPTWESVVSDILFIVFIWIELQRPKGYKHQLRIDAESSDDASNDPEDWEDNSVNPVSDSQALDGLEDLNHNKDDSNNHEDSEQRKDQSQNI
ncbi:hypothetical protein P153DRAFT_391384 [Dothidotthia symphoricarpi CBS 119687]|uniref:Uncharacterized protein n=1 Tax=Dothidotthia symphoricarpi CBS 119687 TaxID=1392245 RepID=A0A6A5ZXA3_9PLEO|nr:uncharacterized protein P153DRAFT_391384 [Dothidotthia symphoricarpi CBS 119687]KAF2123655.1 hypothetical protein P153DRAFT_391384 [Dothidotthia symphoricarpi CBS 119687]